MKLEIKNLSKSFGQVKALDNVNITFENGIYGLLGSNGAGKSTMINLITDNLARQEGEILCDGTDILKLGKNFRKLVGYMPQQQGLYEGMSARTFLMYMADIKEIPRKEAKRQVDELLDIVNLKSAQHRKVGGFSGGMKQRVMLAQALLGDPKLLIMDEPTAGLDPGERIRIRNYISELSRDKIIILATHVVSDIECIANKVLLLKQGKIVKFGTPQELIESVTGKVGEISCKIEEMAELQKKYKCGNLSQRKEGIMLRVVGDDLPSESVITEGALGLEDVFLYYI